MADLKAGLRASANEWHLKTIAIFYDVKVTNNEPKIKTNAIVVFMEDRDDIAYNFYYTYKLESGVLNLGESWREETDRAIFVDVD